MSKRTLPGPHADRFAGVDFNMSSTPNDTPQRATAAQLATRKIKELNRRRPKAASGQSQPQTAFSFGGGTGGTTSFSPTPPSTNGFNFGQSQSFPGAASNPSQNGSQPVTFGTGGSSSFNFGFGTTSAPGTGSAPVVNNPFVSLNGGSTQSQNQTQSGGLFNFSSGTTSASQPQGIFGSTPQTTSAPSFGQPTTGSSAPSTAFQSQPATTGPSNIFGQASTAPTFNSSPLFQPKPATTTATTAPSLFGQSTPATTTAGPSLFGQSAAVPASTSSAPQPQTTATTTSNLFGKSPSPAIGSGPFGASSDTTTSTSDKNSSQQKPAMAGSNIFGQSTSTAPTGPNQTTNGPFSAPNIFGNTSSTPASTNGAKLFGQNQGSNAQNGSLFGTSTPGTMTQQSTGLMTPGANPFSNINTQSSNTTPAKPFAGFNTESDDMSISPDAKPKTNGPNLQQSSIFSASNSFAKQPTPTGSVFAPTSSAAQSTTSSNPFSTLFGGGAAKPTSTSTPTSDSTAPAISAPASKPLFGAPTSSGLGRQKPSDFPAPDTVGKKGGALEAFKPQMPAKSKAPSTSLAPSPLKPAETKAPPRLSPDENREVTKRAQIRDLNRGFKELVASFDPDTQSLDDVILFYLRVRKTMDAPIGSLVNKPGKRKLGEAPDLSDDHVSSKKSKAQESSAAPRAMPDLEPSSLKSKRKVSDVEEDTSPDGKRRATGPSRDAGGSGSTTAGIFANAFASGGSQEKETNSATPVFKPTASASAQPSPFGNTASTSTASKGTNLFAPKPQESTAPATKPAFEVPKFATSGQNFLGQFGKKSGEPASSDAQKAVQDVKLDVPKFNVSSGSSFISQFGKKAATEDDDDDTSDSEDEEPEAKQPASAPAQPKPAASVFDNKSTAPSTANNIFGHLSNSATNTDGDSSDDDLTEHLEKRASQSQSAAAAPSTESSKGSLFDRIRKPDGTPVQVSDDEKPEAPKPVQFGQATTNPFASLNASSTPSSASSIFASKPPTSAPFSNLGIPKSTSNIFSATATPSVTSESNADDTDTETLKDAQLNLMTNAGEEGEDCIFNGRAKGMKMVETKPGEKSWETQGLGPLRVLVHKDTKKARIILRAEPSGRAVLNTAINRAIDYKVQGTSCQFAVPRGDGSGMDLWTLRIKKEVAEELANALNRAKEGLPA